MAEWAGWVEIDGEGRKTLSMREVGKRREEWRDGSRPSCLICHWRFEEDSEQMTPIDSLVDCPVQEVRDALAFGGMDLEGFDSRFVSFASFLVRSIFSQLTYTTSSRQPAHGERNSLRSVPSVRFSPLSPLFRLVYNRVASWRAKLCLFLHVLLLLRMYADPESPLSRRRESFKLVVQEAALCVGEFSQAPSIFGFEPLN